MKPPTIRTDGTFFFLTLPSDRVDGSHEVKFPVDRAADMAQFLLRRQATAGRTIGHFESPTQQMVDQWLAANEPRVDIRAAEERCKALEEKYGVDLDEIEV